MTARKDLPAVAGLLMVAMLAIPAIATAQQSAPKGAPVNPSLQQSTQYGGGTNLESSMDSIRDNEIATVEKLLKLGPTEDEKPKLVFRLAELYGEKSKYCWMQGMAMADEESKYPDDKARLAEIRAQREGWFKKSSDYRNKSMEYYKVILDRYPKYPKNDEVLFYYGFNKMEAQEQTEALKLYRRLITEYPQSSYVPDAYLAFGEYYFNKGELERALEAYKRVTKFEKSRVYGFALYKMGWVYYNQSDWDNALDMFARVIKYSSTATSENKENKITLKREAIKDYVLAYSMLDDTGNVRERFMEVGGTENYPRMMEGLGSLLFDQGKDKQALAVINIIINDNPNTPKGLLFEVKRIEVYNRMGNRKQAVEECGKLVGMFRDVEKAPVPTDPDAAKSRRVAEEWNRTLDEARQAAENKLRDLATSLHNEARKTGKEETTRYALALYKDYLELFPKAADAYTMRFYYAELLYKLGRWEEAGDEYSRVLAADPKGKFGKDAAHSAILAYKEASKKEPPVKEKTAEVPIPPIMLKRIEACENYTKYFKDAENAVDVKYEIGEIYYRYNHFKEANRIFADIAINHPDNKLSEYSVNLILDSFNLAQNWGELNTWSRKFLENPKLCSRERVKEDLKRLVAESSFKMIEDHEKKGEWAAAGQKYLDFVAEFPESSMADQAMFNAAASYEKAKQPKKANDIKLAMLLKYPQSKLNVTVMWSVAEYYRNLADYQLAADYYEKFADKYEKDKNAPTALFNAGTYRFGLEQYADSLRDRDLYVKRYPQEKDAPDVYLSKALIFVKQKDWREAANIYSEFQKRYKNDPKVLWAMINEGLALMKIPGGGDKDKAAAMKLFQRGIEFYNDQVKKGVKPDPLTVEAVAHAAFILVDNPYRAFEAIRLELPEAVFKKRMAEKTKAMEKVYASYTDVVGYKAPEWAVASLYRIGASYENFIKTLLDIPVPKELRTSDQKELYKQMIREYTMPIEDKAVAAYQAALAKSQELGIYNDWSVAALERLTKLRPMEYSFGNEIRIAPVYIGEDVESNGPMVGLAAKAPAKPEAGK